MKRIIPLVFCFWVTSALAAADLPITVAGDSYIVALTENSTLSYRVTEQLGQDVGEHYYGEIDSVPDSWARVSIISGQWQGIVSVYGALYVIDQPVAENLQAAQAASIAMPVQALADLADDMGSCGVAGHESELDTSLVSIMEAGVTQDVAFSDFCAAQVDGLCILPEIEFAFDSAFQSLYGASAAAQATSLINTAEGFYRRDRAEMDGNNGMNMAFDVITVAFLSSEVFSTSTDAGIFLNDIETKKANGQISFITNSQALLHVVTGRDFDGLTAGIANVDVLCNSNGLGVATTSVVGSIPLTAVVMAHELGHNLGSFHDGETGSAPPNRVIAGMCADGSHIMSSSVSSGFTGFSSCSVTQMVNSVEAVLSPNQCFNYPADIAISNLVSPTNVNVDDVFSASYMVSVIATGFQAVGQITLTGTSNVGARFTSVTANGNACSIGSNAGSSYSCTVNNPGGGVTINIDGTITGFNAQAIITHTALISTDDVTDVLINDNSIAQTMIVAGTITAPPLPAGADSDGDGGGGGSLGWPLLLGLFGLLFRWHYS
ncbi:MAG: hypothetical protein JKY90_09655 [Gammaproteobacteria bacterium]|nr:hypothetical protein [Gammaproteobacteria bacterium]